MGKFHLGIVSGGLLLFLALSLAASEADSLDSLARRSGIVSLNGHALHDDNGDFLGLGATYMQALRRTKFDRQRYRRDLATLSSHGFHFIRTLSMVGWSDYWKGLEITPVSFQNEKGVMVAGWDDYWEQFRNMIDISYDEYGLRTELTIFADAQLMPDPNDRMKHMQQVLDNLQGREEKVILLEVANEAWQNGFFGGPGRAQVRQFGKYLADRTEIPIALSSPFDMSNSGIEAYYQESAADIATLHFERDKSTSEGGWLPVRDSWRLNSLTGVPPGSSNEPIGPGSSVESETDPIKLVSAAAFAWMAGLPMYVYHTSAGVRGLVPFENMAGINDYIHLVTILPGNIANWQRSDGKDPMSPFTSFAAGQPNKWWTEVGGSPNRGVVCNIATFHGDNFYALPMGILDGGVELSARRDMTFQLFNPCNGQVVLELTPNASARFILAQGPEAYLIRGSYADSGPARIDLGAINDPHGLVHHPGGDGDTVAAFIGGRNARRNENPDNDSFFYFGVADWFAYQGSKPLLDITVEYFDKGTGALTLQYDSNMSNGLPMLYKNGGSIPLANRGQWMTHTFHVTDAYFGNRQNLESDFRIAGEAGSTFYLDRISISLAPEHACFK